MITNLGRYDIGIFFTANYLCGGSFYDCFEYYCMFKKRGLNTCLILIVNETETEVWEAIKDRYDVNFDITEDMFIFSRVDYVRGLQKIIRIRINILFSPSMSAISQLFVYGILIPHKKIIASQELPYDHPFIQTAFGKYKYNILMLYDDRVFQPFEGYENRVYRQTINFDIFKPIDNPIDNRCLINMCTDHKCYPIRQLKEIIQQYDPEKWLIYTKDQWYDVYKSLESKDVQVLLSPLKNFMNRFDQILYLPSLRELDPSPRLLPECKYFGKKVIYHDFGKIKDGGYWRWNDCIDDFDNLKMTENDKIFDIIGEFL